MLMVVMMTTIPFSLYALVHQLAHSLKEPKFFFSPHPCQLDDYDYDCDYDNQGPIDLIFELPWADVQFKDIIQIKPS